MILNETFASHAHHFDFARRAQAENPFTHQNQVVELQKAAITTQARSQTVPEAKQSTNGTSLKPKDEKETVVGYSRSGGLVYNRTKDASGSRFDSKA
ncbi:hypothetical protein P3G55_05170 [Leptospira sp. 96542]|nr:hypothetical protein [Leptospira sp. 96542]